MPRKRTHEDAPRTCSVTVRLRPETHARMTAEASRLGLSRAGYVEHLIEKRRVELPAGSDGGLSTPLINQLKRLGNNLNQMTHAVNAGLPADTAIAAKTLRDLITLLLEHELTAKRIATAKETATDATIAERSTPHDTPPASTGNELQGKLRLHFARRLESQNG